MSKPNKDKHIDNRVMITKGKKGLEKKLVKEVNGMVMDRN